MTSCWLPAIDRCPPVCYLYHERQNLGMCAVHALNSLLQAPLVSAADLAQIAQEFDAAEHKLLQEAEQEQQQQQQQQMQHSPKRSLLTLAARALGSSGKSAVTASSSADEGNSVRNGDEYGNFSSQVVIEALRRRKFECRLLNDAEYARTDVALDCRAFVVNCETHWFTVRTVANNVWYDFNSFLARPFPVQPARLRAYLDELRRKNYVFFVVTGPLPDVLTEPPAQLAVSGDGQWLPTVVGCGNRFGKLLHPAAHPRVPLPIRLPAGAEPPPTLDEAMRRLQLTFARLHQMEKAVHRRLGELDRTFAALGESGGLLLGLASLSD